MNEFACSECFTQQAQDSRRCTWCGHTDTDGAPISILSREVVKVAPYDLIQMSPAAIVRADALTRARSQVLLQDAQQLVKLVPAIQDVASKLLGGKQLKLVADVTAEIQKKIDSGELKLSFDEYGNLLASLRNQKGRFAGSIRLKEVTELPDLGPGSVNLQMQLAQAEILAKLEHVQQAITGVHQEILADRFGTVAAAWSMLAQSQHTTDARLRASLQTQALSQATTVRFQLQHAVGNYIRELEPKDSVLAFQSSKRKKDVAQTLFDSLALIMQSAQTEVVAHRLLGNMSAEPEVLKQLITFMATHGLDQRDTLLFFQESLDRQLEAPIDVLLDTCDKTKAFLEGTYLLKGESSQKEIEQ